MASVNSERESLLVNEWGNSYTPNVFSPPPQGENG